MTSGKSELATEPQMATTSSESNPPSPTLATPMEIGHSNVEAGNQQPKEEEIVTKKEEEIDEKKEAEIGQNDETKNAKRQQRPAEYTEGLWEAEPFYYCANGPTTASRGQQQLFSQPFDQIDSGEDRRQKRGVVYKHRENLGSANEFECFQSHEGIIYRIGDQVFVESTREEPWLIGCIVSIKMKKRDQLLVKLIRYYRPNDVPELSFSLITQERIEEGHYNHQSNSVDLTNQNANKSIQPSLPHSHNSRELFSSESTLLFHVSALRGKCTVKLVKDLRAALAEIDLNDPDSFFNCLNYNQESGRLASVQMSIRVGTAYQADIPSCSTSSLSDDPDRDELLYRPGYLCAETEQKYVKMTRAFRTFTLMNNKRITVLEKSARTGDLLLDDAVTNLHRSGYNIVDAVETMQAIDKHLTSDSSFMSVEDVKKFGKGIKQYGKNFNKINKELLPNHRREQLVAFYYLWKKSRDATRPKPLSNAKRNQVVAAVGRRSKNGQNGGNNGGWNGTIGGGNGNGQFGNAGFGAKAPEMDEGQAIVQNDTKMDESLIPPLDDLVDYASASETETELLEQQPNGSGRACHHCFSSKSKDWHHAGQHCLLMCTDCRLFYKKYGQLRPVDRPCTVPPCLLASSRESNEEEDENEEPTNPAGNRIRTRGALAGRQHRPRRTPSSLEVGTEQRLRGTPQKLTEEEEQRQQRRSTPLRNSAGKSGRKRAFRTADDGLTPTPTPPKVKRQKKNEESPISTTACSRTPSPLENGELAQIGQGSGRKKISKKIGKDKESQILKKANANEGKITPPPNSGKLSSQNGPSTLSPCSSSEQSNNGNMASSQNNSNGNSPEEMGGNEMKEKDTKMEQKEEELPKNTTQMPMSGPTIVAKKPVAKVEPLDTKKGSKIEKDQQKEEQPTIICVDLSEEDGDDVETMEISKECEQDMGPSGEPDNTEIYRTAEGKKNHLGAVILPEGRTILVRKLRRTSGLTCSRTDIAFVEPAERTKHNQQKREKERQKKEQEKMNKQMAANNQQKQSSQIGMGNNGAKKMEMPAEFVPSSAAAMHPMAALLMNGIGPGAHHHGPQAQILHHQQIAQSSLPSTSASHQSILPSSTPISSHHPSVSVVNGQQHIGNANNALLSQSNASMNPAAVAFLQHQQQQHEQALVMQMMTMERGFMAQLQAMLQQPSQQQQQQQQIMQTFLNNMNHLEQLQRQQQQHQKQQAQAQQQSMQQRPQTAMHLNGQQHPSTSHSHLVNGLNSNHHPAMGGHKMSTGNAPQFKDSAAAQQQQAAAVAMMNQMSQIFGAGNGGFQQSAENHQNQQQQAATLIALQQQQQRLQNSSQSNLANGTNQNAPHQQNAQHNLMNATQHHIQQLQQQNQQNQQANLAAAEIAALTAAIQQQQQNGTSQQQQMQHLMSALLGNGGSTLPANEQRVFEEQIKMHLLSQQHQQQMAAAAAAQQQQQLAQAQAQQQQAAANQQQQNAQQAAQQQQILAALATLGGMPGGAEQIMAQMGQQIAIQQQNQQQQTASASAAVSQQQLQQQFQQVMAHHQHQNQQQQIEMIRRMYQHTAERR